MQDQVTDQFPVLRGRATRPVDAQKVDVARRVLWRAFQHGGLSEDEFASTLDRLEFTTDVPAPEHVVHPSARGADAYSTDSTG